jgi:hypothetical protein
MHPRADGAPRSAMAPTADDRSWSARLLQEAQLMDFQRDAKTAVMTVRRALANLFVSVRADPSQPQDVARRFRLDKTLTWRLSRVICEEDIWTAAPFIPRRPSIEILVTTLGEHGAPNDKIQEVRQAAADYETFIEEHAGDRETMEIMATAAGMDTTDKRIEFFRRDAFRANSAIWGVRAALNMVVRMMTPSKTDGYLDLLSIAGFVGFRRLRSAVQWPVGRHSRWDVKGDKRTAKSWVEPVEPDPACGDIPILTRFSSQPPPKMLASKGANGWTTWVLDDGPIGNRAASDTILGWIDHDLATISASYPGEIGEHGAYLTTPAETFLHDLYIHRSLEFAMNPTAHLYGNMPGGPEFPPVAAQPMELPLGTTLADLGAGPPDLTTPEMPNYAELVHSAMAKLGYKPEDFQAYRLRLRYPPIPAVSILRHPLRPAK